MPAKPETEIMRLLHAIGLAWTQYLQFRSALAELESYSSRELDELGIRRGDLIRLAYEEAERRIAALAARQPVHEHRPWTPASPASS